MREAIVDYFYGTNRFDFKFATTVDEALQMQGEPLPVCDLEKLLSAFPYELFPCCTQENKRESDE